jgi:hypothetical protein
MYTRIHTHTHTHTHVSFRGQALAHSMDKGAWGDVLVCCEDCLYLWKHIHRFPFHPKVVLASVSLSLSLFSLSLPPSSPPLPLFFLSRSLSFSVFVCMCLRVHVRMCAGGFCMHVFMDTFTQVCTHVGRYATQKTHLGATRETHVGATRGTKNTHAHTLHKKHTCTHVGVYTQKYQD